MAFRDRSWPEEFTDVDVVQKELEDAESTKDKKFVKRKTILKKIVANITMGNDSKTIPIVFVFFALD